MLYVYHSTSFSLLVENAVLIQPDSILQESRIKKFKQQLEYVLEDFYRVEKSIDPPLRPLMAPHLDTVVRCLLPGWTTLTWSTMNIDVFLHRVQTSITSLRNLASKVNAVVKDKVYGVLPLIENASLFDLELATSKPWVINVTTVP